MGNRDIGYLPGDMNAKMTPTSSHYSITSMLLNNNKNRGEKTIKRLLEADKLKISPWHTSGVAA